MDAIIVAAKRHSEGATFIQLAAAITPPAPMRNVQRWVSTLVREGRLNRVGYTTSVRYQWVDPEAVGPASGTGITFPAATPVGQALQTLVGQPIGSRPPASYHRDWLDAYRPNVTFYLPADVRALADACRAVAGNGGALSDAAAPLSDAAVRMSGAAGRLSGGAAQMSDNPRTIDAAGSRLVADLAWRSGWLEGGTLTLPVVERLVGGQDVNCDPREAQLVRRQQAAWAYLVANAAQLPLTRDLLLSLHTTIAGLAPSAPIELRRQPLVFAASTYRPPADPVVLEACLAQILTTAAAIAHPIEQAFFAFVHLLALQPLPTFNASVACQVLNLPLLRANLCPITFATVTGRDLLDAVVAVWELHRPELLADLFARAYTDCQTRYVS